MRTTTTGLKPQPRSAGGFSIIELLMSTSIAGLVFVSVYIGFAQGFSIVEQSRAELRATQILLERMETIRLYTWEQLSTTNFLPTEFTAPFYAAGGQTGGPIYRGTITISPSGLSESYRDRLKLVNLQLRWTSGNVERVRQLNSYVTQNGLQSYIY